MRIPRAIGTAVASAVAVLAMATAAYAMNFGGWTPPVNAESIVGTHENLNTTALEGCPFVSQRGDILYFASTRSDGVGGFDIWYSERGENGAWGDPVNFEAINTEADELCPSAHRNGKTFLFVSNRPGYCGSTANDDLYMTRLHATRGWAEPQNLGCTVNSSAAEASPYLLETELYFSSTRPGGFAAGGTDSDIYVSAFDGDLFGPATLAPGLNTASNDNRPNLRRDGLEIFFDSNRSGSAGIDLWTATRASTSHPWEPPVNMGPAVNSTANDLRPSLSWDGTTLYFGSFRVGSQQDIYVTTRTKQTGPAAGG